MERNSLVYAEIGEHGVKGYKSGDGMSLPLPKNPIPTPTIITYPVVLKLDLSQGEQAADDIKEAWRAEDCKFLYSDSSDYVYYILYFTDYIISCDPETADHGDDVGYDIVLSVTSNVTHTIEYNTIPEEGIDIDTRIIDCIVDEKTYGEQ